MKKKLFAFVMAATMVFSLAACGSKDSGNSGDTGTSAPTSGDSVQTFKVGTSGPLPGDNAIYGMAVAEDTGVKGNKVDLYYDTYQQCINFGRRTCTVYILE